MRKYCLPMQHSSEMKKEKDKKKEIRIRLRVYVWCSSSLGLNPLLCEIQQWKPSLAFQKKNGKSPTPPNTWEIITSSHRNRLQNKKQTKMQLSVQSLRWMFDSVCSSHPKFSCVLQWKPSFAFKNKRGKKRALKIAENFLSSAPPIRNKLLPLAAPSFRKIKWKKYNCLSRACV